MPDRTKTPPHDLPKLLTSKELAASLRSCERTISNLEKVPGALPPHVTVGERKLWAVTDVANWIANGGAAQTATAGGQK